MHAWGHTHTALKCVKIQPWTAGHTPYWVSVSGQHWLTLCANIRSWVCVLVQCLCVCVCVYSYQARLFKATPDRVHLIPILPCSGLATVCQQGTRTIHTTGEAVPVTHTLTLMYSHLTLLQRLIGPLFDRQGPDAMSWLKTCHAQQTCSADWIYRCAAMSLCQKLCVRWGLRFETWMLWKWSFSKGRRTFFQSL